jgi:hypothetical protein
VSRAILVVAALAVAGIAVECRGSIVREQYVVDQNNFGHDDIRFSSERAWNETLVIYDDNDRDESDAKLCSTNPRFTCPFLRAGFRYLRVGIFVRRIQ